MFEFITQELIAALGIAFCGGTIGYIIGYNHGSKDASAAWKAAYVKDTQR